MSLLGGIKFVPKGERATINRAKRDKRSRSSPVSSSDNDSDSDSDSDDSHEIRRRHNSRKGEKSQKSDHRKSSRDDRHKKSKKERSSKPRSSKDNNKHKVESDSEVDLHVLASKQKKEESEKYLLEGWDSIQRNDAFERFGKGIMEEEAELEALEREDQKETTASFDSDRFRSLLVGLKGSTPATQGTNPTTTDKPPIAMPTNQNAAMLLRAKLKVKKAPESTSATKVDIDAEREVLLLKSQSKYASKLCGKEGKADEALSLKALIGREKCSDDNMDAIFRSNLVRLGGRFKGTELGGRGGDKAGMDEDAEVDMKMFSRTEDNMDPVLLMKKRLQSLGREREKTKSIVGQCAFCVSSHRFPVNLLLSQSNNVVVRMKAAPYALCAGHVEILPIAHVSSFLQCDDETQCDIERYKSCFRRVFEVLGLSVIFIETAVAFHRHPHCCIEVIPLSKSQVMELPIFFKQAFTVCDEEWAQQHKLIEIGPNKPLVRAVPPQFSYLAVQWFDDKDDTIRGMVHPVENDSTIDSSFCFDVLAGMLHEDHFRMRKGMSVDKRSEDDRLTKLRRDFETYDWTRYEL
jgi:hypothetical protein